MLRSSTETRCALPRKRKATSLQTATCHQSIHVRYPQPQPVQPWSSWGPCVAMGLGAWLFWCTCTTRQYTSKPNNECCWNQMVTGTLSKSSSISWRCYDEDSMQKAIQSWKNSWSMKFRQGACTLSPRGVDSGNTAWLQKVSSLGFTGEVWIAFYEHPKISLPCLFNVFPPWTSSLQPWILAFHLPSLDTINLL